MYRTTRGLVAGVALLFSTAAHATDWTVFIVKADGERVPMVTFYDYPESTDILFGVCMEHVELYYDISFNEGATDLNFYCEKTPKELQPCNTGVDE